MLMRNLFYALIALLPVSSHLPTLAKDWGEIAIRQEGDRWHIRIENSKLRVAYGRTDFGDIVEDQIVDLIIKEAGEDQAGKQFDEMGFGAHAGRGFITSAKVVEEGAQSKTVRIEWEGGKAIQDITIYRDSPILKMDYLKYGINVVDIGSPGGGEGKYAIHGAERWKREVVLYPKIYYDRYPKDAGYENIVEVDATAGSLDYHGWFIMGVYNPANGRGFGRVMPVQQTNIIKLLDNRGVEWFTSFWAERTPFTGFVYTVTGGAEEILTAGRKIADAQLPPAEAPAVSGAPPVKVAQPVPRFRRVVVDGRSGRWYRDVKIAGDFDGDGFIDIAAGHYPLDYKDPAPLLLYRYPEWRQTTIGMGYFTTDGQAADIDSDGDLDIVTGDEMAKSLLWFENPRPKGDPLKGLWRRHVAGTLPEHFTHDIETGDIDRNGKVDVLTRVKGRGTYLWLQQTPSSWIPVKIRTAPDGQGSALADIDRDGDPDIALEGVWLENPGGKASAAGDWPLHRFAEGWPDDVGVAVADLNGDKRPDIVLAPAESHGRLAWYEAPADPRGGAWSEHAIDSSVSYVHTFKIGDIDLDGAPDVAFGEMHQSASKRVGYYLNRNRAASWPRVVLSTSGVHNLRAADIGADGDIDLFGSSWAGDNPLGLWENQLREPGKLARTLPLDRWTYIQVDDKRAKWGDFDVPEWLKYFGLAARDVDRDNDRDIASGRYLYRNPGGDMQGSWQRIEFPLNLDAMVLVSTEQDGRMDAMAQRFPGVYWLKPEDPAGTAWHPIKVGELPKGEHGNGQGYAFAQIEPGGREEVVFSTSHGLFYFRIPSRPAEGNWPRVRVTDNAGEEGFGIGDIDGDTDLDIVIGDTDGHRVLWWENPGNGSGDWPGHAVGETAEWADRVAVADMNGDGKLDAVVSEETPLKGASVYWFEQPADPKGRWARHTVTTQYTTNSMDAADMDGDGDTDIITG